MVRLRLFLLAAVGEEAGAHVELNERAEHHEQAAGVDHDPARVLADLEHRLHPARLATGARVFLADVARLVKGVTPVGQGLVHADRDRLVHDAHRLVGQADLALEPRGLLGPGVEPAVEVVELEGKAERLAIDVVGDPVLAARERHGLPVLVESRRAPEEELTGRLLTVGALDGHFDLAGGDAVAHLSAGQDGRLADLLLGARGVVLLGRERQRHRHVGVAAEGDDVLPLLERAFRPDLPERLARLAATVDAVEERAVGRADHLDHAEPAVGLLVERRGGVVVDGDERLRGHAPLVLGRRDDVGEHRQARQAEVLDRSAFALLYLELGDRDRRRAEHLAEPRLGRRERHEVDELDREVAVGKGR